MSVARFVVAQKKSVKLDVRAASIVLGTDAACALVLDDPIAAPRQCEFVATAGGFCVRDLGSDLGTYRNGLRVAGDVALADGDEVVAGTTRLRVAMEAGAEPTLKLQLVPQDLAFTQSRSGEFKSDPDQWARSEAEVARWPALRSANRWAARVLILGLPALLLWPRAREVLNDPGPLSSGHAALFTAAGSERFPPEAKLAQEQGCGVCHDAFGGTPDSRCAQCHASLVEDQHPFASTTTDPACVRAPLASDSCVPCHQEHHGARLEKPTSQQTPKLCAACHGGTEVEKRGFTTALPPEAVELAPRAYGGFAFAHQDHAAIDCAHCHRQDRTAAASARGPEFAAIAFDTCAACHRKDATDPNVRDEWRPKPEDVWPITWHGSGDGDKTCGVCHDKGDGAGGYGPEFRTVPRVAGDAAAYAATRARYTIVPRSHDEFLPGTDGKCARCHRDAKRALAKEAVRPFWHELHLPAAPAALADDAARQAFSQECHRCHGDLDNAKNLAAAGLARYACASESTCGTCHREGKHADPAARPLVPKAADLPPSLATRQGTDFPHAKHMAFGKHKRLAAGCFACHAFAPTASDAPFAVPITTVEATQCMPCHDQHENVGGGACTKCHAAKDGAYNDFLGKRPPPDRAQDERDWPTQSAFDHFSPGHEASTKKDCAACHRDAGDRKSDVKALVDLASLRAPTEADQVCRDCHFGERQRFHWR